MLTIQQPGRAGLVAWSSASLSCLDCLGEGTKPTWHMLVFANSLLKRSLLLKLSCQPVNSASMYGLHNTYSNYHAYSLYTISTIFIPHILNIYYYIYISFYSCLIVLSFMILIQCVSSYSIHGWSGLEEQYTDKNYRCIPSSLQPSTILYQTELVHG